MKPRNLRPLTLVAGLLAIAVIVLGLIPLNPRSKAAFSRGENPRSLKAIPAAENLDVRSRFAKASPAAQGTEIQKGTKKEADFALACLSLW